MKKVTIIFACMAIALISCNKENADTRKTGVKLTISSTISTPQETKTTYTHTPNSDAGTIATSWEATEAITVVSIGSSGITAVDNFTSTGEAGRQKAEFSGTWNGNVGDKVICLYPALSTPAGAARFSGVSVGSSAIELNFPAHAPVLDINAIKDYDIMVGDVVIDGSKASVILKRHIAVLKLGISGAYYSYPDGHYITAIGVAATTSAGVSKLLGTHGTMAATTSTYTGKFIADTYLAENRPTLASQQTASGVHNYYLPLFTDDSSLQTNDQIILFYGYKDRYGGPWTSGTDAKPYTITSPLSFSPGYVYEIKTDL